MTFDVADEALCYVAGSVNGTTMCCAAHRQAYLSFHGSQDRRVVIIVTDIVESDWFVTRAEALCYVAELVNEAKKL